MGREENLEKLDKELQKEIKEESQVFGIMARIRKVLEHHNLKRKFSVLNFYCNWVFHTKLDRNMDIPREILKKEDPDLERLTFFLAYGHFIKELQDFINKYSLPIFDNGKMSSFLKILTNILVDTPIFISFPTGNVVEFKFHSSNGSIGRFGSLSIIKK